MSFDPDWPTQVVDGRPRYRLMAFTRFKPCGEEFEHPDFAAIAAQHRRSIDQIEFEVRDAERDGIEGHELVGRLK
jgi:hypothetical protein